MNPQWEPLPYLTSDPSTWRARFYALSTVRELADLLEVEYRRLVWVIFGNRARWYEEFTIPKRSGGERQISAPKGSMSILQSKLAGVLSEVYRPRTPVHGFARQRSIVTNARQHRRSSYVLNVDLEDFFPSIHFGRVLGLFEGRPYERPRPVAVALAAICCVNDALPQGAATSPIVSNMLCGQLDSQLLYLAARHHSVYTRYADDITISTRRRAFPEAIATFNPEHPADVALGHELVDVIQTNGFRINERKIRLQHRNERQVVTGLIVNQKPNVQRRLVRQVRSMLHAWEKFGLAKAQEAFAEKWDHRRATRGDAEDSFINVLQGRISFIRMVRGKDDPLGVRLWRRFLGLRSRDVGRYRAPQGDPYVGRNGLFEVSGPEWATDAARE